MFIFDKKRLRNWLIRRGHVRCLKRHELTVSGQEVTRMPPVRMAACVVLPEWDSWP